MSIITSAACRQTPLERLSPWASILLTAHLGCEYRPEHLRQDWSFLIAAALLFLHVAWCAICPGVCLSLQQGPTWIILLGLPGSCRCNIFCLYL